MDATRAATFRQLHHADVGFVMPNAWDPGSAAILAAAGFPAIATTSAGIAFSLAHPDHGTTTTAQRVDRETMLDRARQMVAAVAVPVNGDLEDGYGTAPEAVADTIKLAVDIGLAGANIEDWAVGRLHDEALAADRIVAAREAIAASGSPFVLTARTDGRLLDPRAPLAESIDRANRYRRAGADCVFVPGLDDLGEITTLVTEVDAPVNVVLGLGSTDLTVAALLDAGVGRISLGGTFARAALGFLRASALELAESGTITFARGQIPQRELNALFAR